MRSAKQQTGGFAAAAGLAAMVVVAGFAFAHGTHGPHDTKAKAAAGATTDAQAAQDTKAAPAPLALGEMAPLADVKMMNVDGKQVSLADVRGRKGTLVVFTCNACPWARKWHSRIVELGNKSAKRGIGVIAVNPNDPAKVAEDDYGPMKENAKKSKMAFPYVVDATSDVARAFGATRTPEAFLFDAEGKLVYHGAVDDNADKPDQVKARYLEDAVNAVVDGKAVALAETKAMGCSIKFRTSKT
jgi:peroxiredoxin